MIDILDDPARTGLVVVTTPEEMPVTETIELLDRVARRDRRRRGRDHRQPRAAGAVLGSERRRCSTRSTRRSRAALLRRAVGAKVGVVLDAAALAEARRRVGAGHLDRLRDVDRPDVPVLIVPELFTAAAGRRVVSLVADAIREEIA